MTLQLTVSPFEKAKVSLGKLQVAEERLKHVWWAGWWWRSCNNGRHWLRQWNRCSPPLPIGLDIEHPGCPEEYGENLFARECQQMSKCCTDHHCGSDCGASVSRIPDKTALGIPSQGKNPIHCNALEQNLFVYISFSATTCLTMVPCISFCSFSLSQTPQCHKSQRSV